MNSAVTHQQNSKAYIPVEECAAQIGVQPRTIIDWGRRLGRFEMLHPSQRLYLVLRTSWEAFLQRRTIRAKL